MKALIIAATAAASLIATAASAQQAAAPAAGNAPQTKEQIQAMIDSLDVKLMNGEISEETYKSLVAKWQERLKQLGG